MVENSGKSTNKSKKGARKTSKGQMDVAFELDCGNGPVRRLTADDKCCPPLYIDDDARAHLLCTFVTQRLRVKRDKWTRLMQIEEQQKTVMSFLNEAQHNALFTTVAHNGFLHVDFGLEKVARADRKMCVFVKRHIGTVSVSMDDLICVDLIVEPLNYLVALNEEVYFPLLRTQLERKQWLSLVADGVGRQLNEFDASLSLLKGTLNGITLLPMPPADLSVRLTAICARDLTLQTTIDTYLSQWCSIIERVVEQRNTTSSTPLQELNYWRQRLRDLCNLAKQLRMHDAKIMLRFVEAYESAHLPTFRTVVKGLTASIGETKEIFKYMGALSELVIAFESQPLPNVGTLLHSIGLLGQHCTAYRKNARATTLLRCVGDVFIAAMLKSLNPSLLAIDDVDEAIAKIRGARLTLDRFLRSCESVERQLECFSSAHVNSLRRRLLRIEERLQMLESVFALFVVFNKLDRVELGGCQSRVLNAQVERVRERFLAAYQHFRHAQNDVFDLNDDTICTRARKIIATCTQFDHRLAAVFALAFDNCHDLQSCCKLIAVLGPFGQRPIVRNLLEPKYVRLVALLQDELDVVVGELHNCDRLPTVYNFPPIYAKLLRLKQLERRLRENVQLFHDLDEKIIAIIETDLKRLLRKCESFIADVERIRSEIFVDLADKLRATIERKEADTLLTSVNHQLMVNLDPEYVVALSEIKYISQDIDSTFMCEEYCDGQLQNVKLITNLLRHSLTMYNYLLSHTTVEERAIIDEKVSAIQCALQPALTHLTWRTIGAQAVCSRVHTLIRHLYERVTNAQQNFAKLLKSAKAINRTTMFAQGETSAALIDNNRRMSEIAKRAHAVDMVCAHYDMMLKSNFLLLHDIPGQQASSTEPKWAAYLRRVHTEMRGIVMDGLAAELEFFIYHLDTTVIRPLDGVLFVISVELHDTQITTIPSIDCHRSGNLLEHVDTIIDDIFKLTIKMPTLQSQDIEGDNSSFSRLHRQIKKRVLTLMTETADYLVQYEEYAPLWRSAQDECLKYFLKFGETITLGASWPSCEMMSVERKEAIPSLDQFKEQIDYFETMYDQLSAIDSSHTIGRCLLLDLRPLRQALMNMAQKWAHLFKQHLADTVCGGIRELETFIDEVTITMRQGVRPNDLPALIHLMATLSKIRQRRLITDNVFQPLHMMIDLLTYFNVDLPEEMCVRLTQLPSMWEDCKRLAHVTRQIIAPLQASQVNVIRQQLASFDLQQTLYREEFKRMSIFRYDCDRIYARLDQCNRNVMELEKRMLDLSRQADLFELKAPEFKHVFATRRDLKLLKGLWDYVVLCNSWLDTWRRSPWKEIDVETMEVDCNKFGKYLRAMDKDLRSWDVYLEMEAHLKNMLTSLRAITELQNPSIRERHWTELMQMIQLSPDSERSFTVTIVMDPKTTLDDLLTLRLHDYEDQVRNIVDKSVKEMAMEKMLKDLQETWTPKQFTFELHERTSLEILFVPEDLIEVLDEHQVQLQNMLTSKFIDHFHAELAMWQTRLCNVDQVISTLVEVQRKWRYLESIFVGSEDIRNELVSDSQRFETIDSRFKDALRKIHANPNILRVTNEAEFNEHLEGQLADLVQCEKALNDYLESKRLEFPRFYFISSADLLDTLSNGTQPELIQRHLTKLFDSLAQLDFVTPRKAVAMFSKDTYERVQFRNECECVGRVEEWLTHLIHTMQDTLRSLLSEAVTSYKESVRDAWIFQNAAQIALVGIQVWWSTETNDALAQLEEGYATALKDYNRKQVRQLNTLIAHLVGELSAGDRQKIMTICTIDVHSRDVVAKLVAMRVESANTFQWQSQLRHRWDATQRQCYGNICDAQIEYQYEYLGNTPRLVITPLTDRCYITLTQSLHLIMGGAPAGPAGTGKTETTKDLGKALGVMVYVFNCSEQMDYKSMGSIYKGLAQTGTWGCFDEFNRISVEVLSVVAVQVKTIQDAIKQRRQTFRFLGDEIKLIPSVGIFITMNPGYAGRTELPENLMALFRPCAMVAPDLELICEIMLVAEGFREARLLARKFIALHTLCKQLLSAQDHYDWGLRAIKSVLVVAGALKRNDHQRPEDEVLMRALRDFNVPKIVADDLPIFGGLILDLFPTLDVVPRMRNFDFEQIVKRSASDLRLQPEDGFVTKVVQLAELFAVRHSVFVIGAAGTGKSSVWKTLLKTYTNQKCRPMCNDLSPKAVSNDELFGAINPTTREWRDGLFSMLMREQANAAAALTPRWIVLDGDVDPTWIESLNTLMDDNKVLTLASNERIALTPSMRLLFEVGNLRAATPATVSRAGILYVNPNDLGWSAFVTSWLDASGHASERSTLITLFDKYVPPCLHILATKCRRIVPLPDINHVAMLCVLLDCVLIADVCEMCFVFCTVWAFGAALHHDHVADWRAEFSTWFRATFKTVRFPHEGTVFDYYIDSTSKRFMSWRNIVQQFELSLETPLRTTLVDTIESRRVRFFLQHLIVRRVPCMLVGPAGCGKSVLVQEQLATLSDTSFLTVNVPLNFYTSSAMLQRTLERRLEKKAGRVFAPIGNRQLICVLDDLNTPQVDRYFSVQPHALLRQHIDYQHWYDRSKLTLKDVRNVQYVACLNPAAGTFRVDPRLHRHFYVFALQQPTHDSLFTIYDSILRQHLQQASFGSAMHTMCRNVVDAALTLHDKICVNFLPTAARFHYVFNMRDLSNVFQGMLFATGDIIVSRMDFVRLWAHESMRAYVDKMVSTKDVATFVKLLNDTATKSFDDALEESSDNVTTQPLIFCHFADGIGDRKYAAVKSYARLQQLLTDAQVAYNDVVAAMHLVLFEDAMHHVCRINRALEAHYGHLLLVGVGGSGKQSLTRLAAFIAALDVFQVQLRPGYDVADLRQDIAGLYVKAGVKNIASAFMMTDWQVASEECLVLVNDMLASGDIPDLLTDDEIDEVVTLLKSEVKAAGVADDSRERCWRYFIEKVRKLVKVVLCFSPMGSTLRVRSRKFPALINCTTMNWFHDWPKEALTNVAMRFLADLRTTLPADCVTGAAEFMSFVHLSVNRVSEAYLSQEKRYNYTTPKTFLEQIALYRSLLTQRSERLTNNVNRLECGLLKLEETAHEVDELQIVLAAQEVDVAQKNSAADELICMLRTENEIVAKEQALTNAEEARVKCIEEDVASKAKTCEDDLLSAEPALQAAKAALDTLNKHNLTELKSFGSPPDAVVKVCAAVVVLFARNGKIPKDRTWKACKALMGKVDQFLADLLAYDKEHIHPDVVHAVLPYVDDPEFDPQAILSKSIAAAGLCAWVINILKYHDVFLVVEPKRRALAAATEELSTARHTLRDLKGALQRLESRLAVLRDEYDNATNAKLKCQQDADATTAMINLAHRLIDGLSTEELRWRASVAQLNDAICRLPGDLLLVTAFVSYAGGFTHTYRVQLVQQQWLPQLVTLQPTMPTSSHADALTALVDDALIATWRTEGLPADRMSIENATILTHTTRWPLMIDPQLQGVKWIKHRYGTVLTVIRPSSANYLATIERAVSTGGVVLLENVGEVIDGALDPILSRTLVKRGKCIKLSDREVDYDPHFKLIMQTKLSNPHYRPEVQAQTTLINFTVTRSGLEEQLLAEVVKCECPDLERSRAALSMQQNAFEITLRTCEEDLLERLSSATGNILADVALIVNLETTKRTAHEIATKAAEARCTSTQINDAREQYRPAASRAALLYFILNDLHRINPLYVVSLKSYARIFTKSLRTAPTANTLPLRVHHLLESITYAVCSHTSRGLFERDKLVFLAQTTLQILQARGETPVAELEFLLRFPVVTNVNSPCDFVSDLQWGGIKTLAQVDAFRLLDRDIESSSKRWRRLVDSECPEREPLPGEWKNKSSLQQLCIMRCLRPDRMVHAMRSFIEHHLGTRYVQQKAFSLEESIEEANTCTPILFILSPGIDPLTEVAQLGRRLGYTVHSVALGQGQDVVAESAMRRSAIAGHWLILHNIHLSERWLPALEKSIEQQAVNADTHRDYRLLLSTEPTARLPLGVLETSIKITNEPPAGMHANLRKALSNFSQETLDMCSKAVEFRTILFALCYFHAVVTERGRFGSQGWNRSYPFNIADLTISAKVLHNYLENNDKLPWEDLRYLFGEIMYGGHIADEWDRRLCRHYLQEFVQPALLEGELYLAPGFKAPLNTTDYQQYVDAYLPPESPHLYGLHPNAEIGCLTTTMNSMFSTIFEMQSGATSAGNSSLMRDETIRTTVDDVLDRLPDAFAVKEMMAKMEEHSPPVVVCLQECDRMNNLLDVMRTSLRELRLALNGDLTMTPAMETLEGELFLDQVPQLWAHHAYPSLLPLGRWCADLRQRIKELDNWTHDFAMPAVVWLGGLFNPQSFLTAIMQQIARKRKLPLDKMRLHVNVTRTFRDELLLAAPREGANIYGLHIEGARWDVANGVLADAILKELCPTLPIISLTVTAQDGMNMRSVYECPMYKTRNRGTTYVWTFDLETQERPSKWVLAGVALLLQV